MNNIDVDEMATVAASVLRLLCGNPLSQQLTQSLAAQLHTVRLDEAAHHHVNLWLTCARPAQETLASLNVHGDIPIAFLLACAS